MTTLRDQIIRDMCLYYRSDFDIAKQENDPPWLQGLTPSERQGLWQTMSLIYDQEIAPRISNENTDYVKTTNRLQRQMGKPRAGRNRRRSNHK